MHMASELRQDAQATPEQIKQQVRQDMQATRNQLREQIRQQVREQVRAAQEQAAMAREQAAMAREQARMARERAGTETMPAHSVRMRHAHPIPPEAVHISLAFFLTVAFVILGLPLLRAFGRRLGTPVSVPVADPDIEARLTRIEQAVQAVAIEVERIGEGQRFTSHLFAKAGIQPTLGASSGASRR
jgi:hypothetical protein